jgi:DNA-binding CsgD family transcriptional regulator
MENSNSKNLLTPREIVIAFHIANGSSTSSIAKILGIKSNTVSTFKKKIYNKLGVDSSVGLYKAMQG